MTRIKIDLTPEREPVYTSALDRLGITTVTNADHDALITGDPTRATASDKPCLLDQPGCPPAPSHTHIMPAHPWRFLPETTAVHQSLTSGQLGQPGLLRIHHWLTSDTPIATATFPQIDLAHWLFASPPASVHTLARPGYLQLHLGFAGSGMALIDIATARPGDADYYSLHLIGSEGAAYADDHRNTHLLFDTGNPTALVHHQNFTLATTNMLAAFVAAVENNHPWPVTTAATTGALETLQQATGRA